MPDHWCIACESFALHSEVEELNQLARGNGFSAEQIDQMQRDAMLASETTGHLYSNIFRTLMAVAQGADDD